MTEEDGDTRMRRLMKDRYERPLPKRFYKVVNVSLDNGILLDGRSVKTPLKSTLQLPNKVLADAVAIEWRNQEKVINPGLMPLTKLANTAIDRAHDENAHVVRDLVDYANSDLVCYRAEAPDNLVQRQKEAWNPALDWIKEKLGVQFSVSIGVMHNQQSDESLAAFEGYLLQLDRFQLTAHYNISTLIGSALIGTMLIEEAMEADHAWSLAHLDEDFQIEQWGWDAEAQSRRKFRRMEFDASLRFAELARSNLVFTAQGTLKIL
jgi:chaperone required for assembly of F1-ATPase